jgi:hypothetical protein
MNPITNPFSRDEHPDLTAAIIGVVNEAKAAQKMDEDYQTPSRAALCPLTEGIKNEDEFRAKLAMARVYSTIATKFDKYSKGFRFDDLGYMAAGPEDLTPQYKKELENWAKTFKKMSVKLDNELYRYDHPQKKTKRKVQEAASPQGGGKKPFNPFNPTLGDLLHSKAQDKPAPKPKPVKEAVTPAQQKVFTRERERMLSALNNPKQKLSPTEREAVLARGARNAAAETRKGAVSPTGEKSPIHSAAKAHHEYARRESKKLDAIAKRKVQEDYQTPARERQMKRKMKAAEHGSDAASSRYMQALDAEAKTADTNPKAAKAVRAAGERFNAAVKKRNALYTTQRKEEMSKRLYGAGGKMLKRKVQEGAQLDERIIDEVDFFQASKNWIKGKGFKTNREATYDRVNKNYAAMKKREAAAKAKKTK